MRDPTQRKVLDAIDKGIRKAQEDYEYAAWTALCQSSEHLITVSIFYSLLNLTKKNSLTLESKPNELLKWLEKKRRPGRPQCVPRGEGRVDICLWHKDEDRPRAIIEVKRCAEDWVKHTDTKDTDIDRIAKLLLYNSARKFKFGILASCIHRVVKNNNRNELEREINDNLKGIRQDIEEKLDGQLGVKLEPSDLEPLQLKYPEDEDSKDWIWRPVVFMIYHKRNRR